MKKIAILVLGMGMVGSAVVQAQQTGQGSPVPRPNIVVAQAEKPTVPGSPAPAAPAATAPGMGTVLIVLGVSIAAIIAASSDSGTTTTHH